MADEPHLVHSLSEAHLFLMAARRCACGHTGGAPTGPLPEDGPMPNRVWRFAVRCSACGLESSEAFQLLPAHAPDNKWRRDTINPTDEPSKILDAAQWMSLYALLVNSASRTDDAGHARQLKIEAGECIGEALKFYDDDDNDLPPSSAFFSEESRARFLEFPGEFSRQRLINLRAHLPKATGAPPSGRGSSPSGMQRWWAQCEPL